MAFFKSAQFCFYDILDLLLHFEMNGAIDGNITNMIKDADNKVVITVEGCKAL